VSTIGTIAAIIAAAVAMLSLALGLIERRRARLLELLDMVIQLKAIIEWGPNARAT
jgi:hypothetical protein